SGEPADDRGNEQDDDLNGSDGEDNDAGNNDEGDRSGDSDSAGSPAATGQESEGDTGLGAAIRNALAKARDTLVAFFQQFRAPSGFARQASDQGEVDDEDVEQGTQRIADELELEVEPAQASAEPKYVQFESDSVMVANCRSQGPSDQGEEPTEEDL